MERRIRRCYNPAHKKDTKIQWLPVWKMVCISGILICFAGGQFIKSIRGFPESISLGSSVCWGSIDQSNDSSRPLTSQIDKERNTLTSQLKISQDQPAKRESFEVEKNLRLQPCESFRKVGFPAQCLGGSQPERVNGCVQKMLLFVSRAM